MQYALWIRHCISPTFHLCGHMDSKFKMRPVCVAFRNTWEENVPLSSVGSDMKVSRKASDELPYFWSCVKRFTNNKFSSKPISTVKEDRIEAMFSIPYIGLPSVIFGRKVRESFRKLYGIDIKVIYTSFKVKNYFSLKCHTPLPLLAKVVYKFQCLHDVDKVYIGKTRRHLATRVKEHGHSTSSSAIRDHLSSCPTCQSEYSSSSFRVIDTARNDFEVTIKEALHIKNSKPALNRQLFNSGSSFVLNIF